MPRRKVRETKRPGFEWFIETLIRVLGVSTIGIVAVIFLFLLTEGVPAFVEVPLGNLFGARWYPTFDLYGTIPLLFGSLLITLVAMLIAFPLGVCTAVFIREVAPNWAREVLKPMIEIWRASPPSCWAFSGW